MNKFFSKARFYFALYSTRAGLGRADFAEISKEPLSSTDDSRPERLRAYFWTPKASPGANVIVHDMLPTLREEIRSAGLSWEVDAGEDLPREEVDWLVCFKAVPEAAKIVGNPRKVFLICDMKHYFWSGLREFDAVVVAPSRTMASFVSKGHPRVSFLGESEPMEYLEFGSRNLATAPDQRGNVLMWHGGKWSIGALLELRPALEDFARERSVELHAIGGQEPEREEQWDKLKVRFFPWSKQQLFNSAAQARLGIVPARRSLRLSWLKPASRVRCLYSLGVPAIGDARTPDLKEFLSGFDGTAAADPSNWGPCLAEHWDATDRLSQLATDGYAAVSERFSTRQTARQWIRFFCQGDC